MTKSGMRGFAAGMLVTAAIIAYFYFQVFQTEAKTEAKPTEVTSDSVDRYLSEQGLKAVNAEAYDKWQKATKEKDSEAEDNGDTATTDEPKDDASVVTADLNIQSGMSSGEVADILEQKKIIKDSQTFSDYLDDHQLMELIQIGTFQVSSDMSLEEIAKKITS